ncbi:MAG: SinI family restriction endonuclease [Oscillochloris sp.]|nr:SinI family restriction endonuclease [Oscillochloris sp.]
MDFDKSLAVTVAAEYSNDQGDEAGLVEAFAEVCNFLADNPNSLSWRSKGNIPSVFTSSGLQILAQKYFAGYRKSDLPGNPRTVPDEIVSLAMMEAFGYAKQEVERIKIEHQLAMSAENCVGALLERYLDKELRPSGWYWCCGGFVKAVDFIRRDRQEQWLALQIKNRDNSENSSSSAIRQGTIIQKWFRTFSRTGATNWSNLPSLMQGYNLNEQGFENYVRSYISSERLRSLRDPGDILPLE